MNERIRQLAEQAREFATTRHPVSNIVLSVNSEKFEEKFAELIVEACSRLNKKNSFELLGVIVDTEEGAGFDSVCLDTVKRVEQYLFNNSLKDHFGVKE